MVRNASVNKFSLQQPKDGSNNTRQTHDGSAGNVETSSSTLLGRASTASGRGCVLVTRVGLVAGALDLALDDTVGEAREVAAGSADIAGALQVEGTLDGLKSREIDSASKVSQTVAQMG
jgi:hypothetical protein